MTRKHPHVALFLAASAALAMSAMPPTLAAPEAAASGCQAAPKGLVENSWLGGSGSWSDATKWSQQVVPGLATRDYACLPTGADVVVDASVTRVDLDLLDLDSGARLTLQPGSALYVWGDQKELRSVVRSDAVLEVDGATLGGGGRLQVIGTVDVHRVRRPARRRRSARGRCRHRTQGPHGPPGDRRPGCARRARSSATSGFARKYVVDVRGLVSAARERGTGGRQRDHDAAAAALPTARVVGRLLIRNDRGFVTGRPRRHQAAGDLRERGPHRQARQPGLPAGSTGPTSATARSSRSQVTSSTHCGPQRPIRVVTRSPVAAPPHGAGPADGQRGAADHRPRRCDGQASSLWRACPVRGRHRRPDEGARDRASRPTFADPAVIELRYDASLFTAPGTLPADPAVLVVKHADGPERPLRGHPGPACGRGAMPLGATSRAWTRSASRTEDGGLVLVVRTTDHQQVDHPLSVSAALARSQLSG